MTNVTELKSEADTIREMRADVLVHLEAAAAVMDRAKHLGINIQFQLQTDGFGLHRVQGLCFVKIVG